jgi:tetratricopeptide (TPR) repeat protein
MSDKTAKNLFIGSSTLRLYQRLQKGADTYNELGNRILSQIKAFHAFRQTDSVRELARVLINNPIKEFQLIGEYYLAWSQLREKKYHAQVLENVIEHSRTFKAQALISRAALEHYQGNFKDALYFYSESFKAKPTASEYVLAAKAIAVIKSIEGFPGSALRDLESLMPVIKYAEPFPYFDYLNSLAVELGGAGRKSEARNVIKLALASPYALAYPEWHQTGDALKPPGRSSIVQGPSPASMGKLLSMPPARQAGPVRQGRPATVISLEQWKKKMIEENNKPAKDKPKSKSEQVMYIMNHITADLTEDELDEVIELLNEIHSRKDKK